MEWGVMVDHRLTDGDSPDGDNSSFGVRVEGKVTTVVSSGIGIGAIGIGIGIVGIGIGVGESTRNASVYVCIRIWCRYWYWYWCRRHRRRESVVSRHAARGRVEQLARTRAKTRDKAGVAESNRGLFVFGA